MCFRLESRTRSDSQAPEHLMQVQPSPHRQKKAFPAAVVGKSVLLEQVQGLQPQCSPQEHFLCSTSETTSSAPEADVHLQAMPPGHGEGQPHLSLQTEPPLPLITSAIILIKGLIMKGDREKDC